MHNKFGLSETPPPSNPWTRIAEPATLTATPQVDVRVRDTHLLILLKIPRIPHTPRFNGHTHCIVRCASSCEVCDFSSCA